MSRCGMNGASGGRLRLLLLVRVTVWASGGCRALCKQVRWCPYCPPECQLSADSTPQQVIAHLNANADRVREVLSGCICRCTGYIPIVEAVLEARAAYSHKADSP